MERHVGPLKVSTWTRIMAWFRIVTHLVEATGLIYHAYAFSPLHHLVLLFIVILSFAVLLGLFVAVLLLVGSVHGFPHYIKAWLVFTGILTVVEFALIVVLAATFNVNLSILFVLPVLNVFTMYVANLHLGDVQKTEGDRSGAKETLELEWRGSTAINPLYENIN